MDLDWLAAAADDLLDRAAAALTPAGGADPRTAPPEHRYVTTGPIAWDCPAGQLTVHVDAAQLIANPGSPPCGGRPEATFTVTLLRCAAMANLDGTSFPPAATLDTEGRGRLVDGWALLAGLTGDWTAGQLLPSLPHLDCTTVTWGPMQAVGPAGGLAGWSLTLTVRP